MKACTALLLGALLCAFPAPASGQSLWGKEAIICQTDSQAQRVIALNEGRIPLGADWRNVRGCGLRLVEFIRLAVIEEEIWHGIKFKVLWILAVRLEENGQMRSVRTTFFTIVWEPPMF